ncbi:MAG TPA: 2Fe-2S iron-sulfur cluster-binding protein [Yinghuangia sp.]|nr:2Fe-2S iron-sulfur cluster-binding protein [Yinghuangia sp.]
MTVPPNPAPGGSAADIPGFGTPAPGHSAPEPPYDAATDDPSQGAGHDPGRSTGHEPTYAAPYGGQGSYDAYDPASEIAATSGFGFPVPRPAVAPVPDPGFHASEPPLTTGEFASGAASPADTVPRPEPEPMPVGHAVPTAAPVADPAGLPLHATEFVPSDGFGTGAQFPPSVEPPYLVADLPGGPVVSYTIRVNGTTQVVDQAWIGENLLHVLRERLGLPGAKDGCGQGVCGACTVLVDGAPATACLVPAAALGERGVTTIEGVSAQGGLPVAIQRALIDHGAVQCGFCVPGIVMSAHALLSRLPGADEPTIRRALAGHPCRCVGPNRMVAAVCAVAAGQATQPAASLFEPADASEPQA